MRGLAAFILRSRWQAALVVGVAFLLPFVNLVSNAALSLVTLRQGGREGLLVLGLATGVTSLLTALLMASPAPAVFMATVFWLPLWLLALTLRMTVSLAKTVRLALLLAGLGLLAHNLYVGDATNWGRMLLDQVLRSWLEPVATQAGTPVDWTELLDSLAPLVEGLLFANGLASLLTSLFLGRWWQALLFNPGGFRREFHELRLDRQVALAALVVFALAVTLDASLAVNLSLLFLVVYTVQGLAVAHGAVGRAKLGWGWLAGLYVLLFLALPQLVLVLSLVGILDAWLDFRGRIKTPMGKAS